MEYVVSLCSGSLEKRNRFYELGRLDYILTEQGHEALYNILHEMEIKGLAKLDTTIRIK